LAVLGQFLGSQFMSEFLFRGQMRKRIRRHVYLHGKKHYTIHPRVKCVSTRHNFTVDGPLVVERGLMSMETTAWGLISRGTGLLWRVLDQSPFNPVHYNTRCSSTSRFGMKGACLARRRVLRSERVLSYNVSILGIQDVVLLRGLLILGLVGLNAFFAATEYALLSVRRTRIEQLVREGDPRARLVQALLADIGSLISGT